jgi:transposase
MAIATTQEHSEEKFSVPLDLTEWIDAQTIRAWVNEEIDTLDWSNPELKKELALHPNLRPRELLTILSYAYAVGIYESEEISRLCTTDRTFRELSGKEVPSHRGLERFRRENRGLLKWILVQVFKRALREKHGLNISLLPSGLKQYLIELATERLNLARHMDRAQEV